MISMRVIADHIRTLTFAIADGATPGNEGRGYVLRRLLRRAARYGRKINLKEPFLNKLVHVVVENFSHVFPEIKSNQSNIEKIIKAEEESFNATLDRGIELFDALIKKLNVKNEKVIPGDDVFKLYDTFGFPVDLTAVMAREQEFSIDEKRFNELMNEQKERARKSTATKISKTFNLNLSYSITTVDQIIKPTIFTGYDELRSDATIIDVRNDNNKVLVILDRTPFYVESGGQVGDKGNLFLDDTHLRVVEVAKVGAQIIHVVENESGIELIAGMKVLVEVDSARRWNIMRNHSATHFLHKAMRQILGQHVQQSGSYVGPDYLRFDFTHFQKVSETELEAIEFLVNEKIRENLPLNHHKDTPFDEAKKMGALMFFGDKYGDKVNVVQFGDFTMEFCGGTHVKNSSQIGLFKILSESSVASGIRRIEAVTGAGVEKYIKEIQLRIENGELRIGELNDEKRKLEKELAELKLKEKLGGIDAIVSSWVEVKGIKVFKGRVSASNMDELKSMGDELREKMKSGIGVMISEIDGKVGIVSVVSDDLIKEKKILAGNIVKEVAKIVGGSGGGRPHLATAGGKDVSKIDEALASVENIINA
jgi:alanyl-tRNA synthetase